MRLIAAECRARGELRVCPHRDDPMWVPMRGQTPGAVLVASVIRAQGITTILIISKVTSYQRMPRAVAAGEKGKKGAG